MAPNPDLEIETVVACDNPAELALAKAILEEAGIPYLVEGESIGERLESLNPFPEAWNRTRIAVASDRAAEARAILQPLEDVGETIT